MAGKLEAAGGHCPRCGAEFGPGSRVCADDGTPLLPGPTPGDGPRHGPPAEPPWVRVASLLRSEALLLAGRLRAEGIDAAVDPPDVGGWPGYPWGGMPERVCGVLVPPDRVAEARGVIEEVRGVP